MQSKLRFILTDFNINTFDLLYIIYNFSLVQIYSISIASYFLYILFIYNFVSLILSHFAM